MPKGPVEETRKPPKGHRALAFAVVEQGVQDVAQGKPKERHQAWEWMASRSFEYWCDWCDLNPDYLRRSVAPLLAKERVEKPHGGGRKGSGRVFSAEEMARAAALHQVERNWNVVARALGTNTKTMLDALKAAGYDTGRRNRIVTRRGVAAR